MRIFQNFQFGFLSRRKYAYLLSSILFLIGLISAITRGFHFGVDFNGGSEIVLQFEKPIQISSVREYVDDIGLGFVEVKTFGDETGVMFRTDLQSIPPELYPKVINGLETEIDKVFPNVPRQIIDSTNNSITYSFANPDTTNKIVDALLEAGFQASKVSEEPNNNQMVVSIGIADWIKENLRTKISNNSFSDLEFFSAWANFIFSSTVILGNKAYD